MAARSVLTLVACMMKKNRAMVPARIPATVKRLVTGLGADARSFCVDDVLTIGCVCDAVVSVNVAKVTVKLHCFFC